MCYWRIFANIRQDRGRNTKIRNKLDISINKEDKKKHFKLFGHIVRTGEGRKPRQIMEAQPEEAQGNLYE